MQFESRHARAGVGVVGYGAQLVAGCRPFDWTFCQQNKTMWRTSVCRGVFLLLFCLVFVFGPPGRIFGEGSTTCPPPSSHNFPWYGAMQEQLKLPIWSVQLAPWRQGLGSHWFPSAKFHSYCYIVFLNRWICWFGHVIVLTIIGGPEGVLQRKKSRRNYILFLKTEHQIIVTNQQGSDRLGCVFKILARLLVAADLLYALAFQVALQHLLYQEHVGPFRAQECSAGRVRAEHCKNHIPLQTLRQPELTNLNTN